MAESEFDSGARWHRWDPHIHAPGTVLNNQFGGADPWEAYLTSLETATPAIRALGITDYYSVDTYEKVVAAKKGGRLANCDLIFPNVEMRLGVGTLKGSFVNVHLLVSPEDANHVDELKRILNRLTFNVEGDTFACNPADLIRLGRRHDSSIVADNAALRAGSQQFKVSIDQLRDVWKHSEWARENILIAVAGSSNDGTSGVRDASDATLRRELETLAHIIFSSSPSQRSFWLGQGALNLAELRKRYGSEKPCLHGSDAHEQAGVAAPHEDRFSWVKGGPTFDALRQAYIDPNRAFVGSAPPVSATPSQVIESVSVQGAVWAKTSSLKLNSGLVAIIGARGSGKTALAEMIAAACDALPDRLGNSSFLSRASEFLGEVRVTVRWANGDEATKSLAEPWPASFDAYPRARYLSQQFVDELCSADGMTDRLLAEIERVIFQAHNVNDREGAINFEEMLEIKAGLPRQTREHEREALVSLSERISNELEKQSLVPVLQREIAEKTQLIHRQTADRASLVIKGGEERLSRLGELSEVADKVRGYIRYWGNQERSLLNLQSEVNNVRKNVAPEMLRNTRETHAQSGFKDDTEWDPFLLRYKDAVDSAITGRLEAARKNVVEWKGIPPEPKEPEDASLLVPDIPLEEQTLAVLEAEIAKLEKLISADRNTAAKFTAISQRITEETTALASVKERLEDCEGAKARAGALAQERTNTYQRLFEAVLEEEGVLNQLYAPLMARLTSKGGTVGKLSFSVSRTANVDEWATRGEDLFDKRRSGTFKGRGTLTQYATEILKPAWEADNAEEVAVAMAAFRDQHQEELLSLALVPKTDVVGYREWLKRFAHWLYSTDHITIRYGIDYAGVDIRKLSPGTRGIVLLLLYLALDDADDRPLIIDQPEENLDPKSIFDELVGLFVAAKSKRQVVIVTHNANLVVNADADQIIIAEAEPHAQGKLPPIHYTSGGLERAPIRKAVCDILEGGEPAFLERARRLRVALNR
jgi:energy-coupling factor transporter ATP-binding protein EcfA2